MVRVHAGNIHFLEDVVLSGRKCAGATSFLIFFGGVGAAFSYPQEAQSYLTVTSGTYGKGKPFCTPLFSVVVVVIVIFIVVRCRIFLPVVICVCYSAGVVIGLRNGLLCNLYATGLVVFRRRRAWIGTLPVAFVRRRCRRQGLYQRPWPDNLYYF